MYHLTMMCFKSHRKKMVKTRGVISMTIMSPNLVAWQQNITLEVKIKYKYVEQNIIGLFKQHYCIQGFYVSKTI